MTNTEIIYNALVKSGMQLPELEVEEANTWCMVCGKEISKGVKMNKVVSGNFTDYDEFENLGGTHICIECGTCIKTRELRVNNFIADKNNIYIINDEISVDEFEGQPLEIWFNIDYFYDVLSQYKNETVSMEFGNRIDPLIIKSGKKLEFLLPVRPRTEV